MAQVEQCKWKTTLEEINFCRIAIQKPRKIFSVNKSKMPTLVLSISSYQIASKNCIFKVHSLSAFGTSFYTLHHFIFMSSVLQEEFGKMPF